MTNPAVPSDFRLASRVRSALDSAVGVPTVQVFSRVDDGVVTLAGVVDSVPQRMAAKNAALSVDGVVTVIDSLIVPLPTRTSDAVIAQAVERVLRQLPDIPQGTVQAEIRNHVVTLTGAVTWNYQRQGVERLVAAIAHVAFVEDRISVRDAAARVAPDTTVRRAG